MKAECRHTLQCQWRGVLSYRDALDMQYALVKERVHKHIPDTILLLEHPAVITMGRRGSNADILASPAQLEREQIEVHNITRGGEVTYHGRGQLVGYIIFDLRAHIKRIAALMHGIEAAIAGFLSQEYGLAAHTDPRHPGVWIEDKKIAAVGVSIQHGITLHGFALNIATDLRHFSYIVACGIKNIQHTSLQHACPHLSDNALNVPHAAMQITPYLSDMHHSFFLG